MVGAVRFELTTSCTRNKRATKLRYAPNQKRAYDADRPPLRQNLFQNEFHSTPPASSNEVQNHPNSAPICPHFEAHFKGV